MKKKVFSDILRYIPPITGIILLGAGLITFPRQTAQGVKDGLTLLSDNLIPSLFPFMILSGYIGRCPLTEYIAHPLDKLSKIVFRSSGYGLMAFLLGCIGGYPIGAKAIADFKDRGKLSQKQAERMLYWCVNPGASFVITAVGTFMLGNTVCGVIIYISCLVSSIIIGIVTAFMNKENNFETGASPINQPPGHIFVSSVSASTDAMLGICGWVLFFSVVCTLCDSMLPQNNITLFIKAIAEVTIGSKNTVKANLPVPVLCAVISFGGLAVTAQIFPCLEKCGTGIKNYLCWRVAGAAISAFICSQILRIFPQYINVSTSINHGILITGGVPTTLFMLLMCVVLIFEVDNKRKVC